MRRHTHIVVVRSRRRGRGKEERKGRMKKGGGGEEAIFGDKTRQMRSGRGGSKGREDRISLAINCSSLKAQFDQRGSEHSGTKRSCLLRVDEIVPLHSFPPNTKKDYGLTLTHAWPPLFPRSIATRECIRTHV